MTNLVSIVENDFAKNALLESERARGKNMDEVDYKLKEVAFLVPRIRHLKKAARDAYSFALKAGSNKQERERYRSKAQDINNELEICVLRYNKLQSSFGNVVRPGYLDLKVCHNEETWTSMLARFMPRMFMQNRNNLLANMQDQLQSLLQVNNGYSESNLPRSLVKLPLCIWSNKNQYAVLEFRYLFDPNKQLDDDAFEFVLETLERSFHSSANFLTRKAFTPQKLLLSACASCIVAGESDGRIYARISMERDFVMRQMDVRIEKRVRAKLAVSPHPSSIYVEIFEFVGNSKNCKEPVSSQRVEPQSNNSKDMMILEQLRAVIENKQLDIFFEIAEDKLESQSFLSGHTFAEIDELAFRLLQEDSAWKAQKPSVQYPCIHRWFRGMTRTTFL